MSVGMLAETHAGPHDTEHDAEILGTAKHLANLVANWFRIEQNALKPFVGGTLKTEDNF